MRTHGQKSQKVERSQSLKNYAHRRHDAQTEEFIRFIRDFQIERQPTHLRLQKQMAPLPEIGRANINPTLRDSGFLDKASDNSDNDDVPLDNEVLLDNSTSSKRKNRHVDEVLTLARSQTRDRILLSRSLPNGLDGNLNSLKGTNKRSNDRKKLLNKNSCVQKSTAIATSLPPIQYEDLPDRPTAPSPSKTPPVLAKDASFIEEEPIDFIDPA
ncbi:hypothetical protein FSP39_004407 [Pinctada imbricata]|uniref:Uncharacterized protein n=1 Tax=Pinctada imbricata TaxID=66713 RepID=A0AA88XY75_PINIB|nr:hypothetical protein FSP39_004407 [Pinctada imbricata]